MSMVPFFEEDIFKIHKNVAYKKQFKKWLKYNGLRKYFVKTNALFSWSDSSVSLTGPKIIDFNLILVAVGPNILIGLEIAVETYFPLTFLTIEKFANETHSIIKIPNPEIDTQNKTIKVLNECCFCESIVSYQVTVENIFKKDLSEKIHIYLFQGNRCVIKAMLLIIFCSLYFLNKIIVTLLTYCLFKQPLSRKVSEQIDINI